MPTISLVNLASVEYLNRQVFPQLRLWTLQVTVDFGGKDTQELGQFRV